MLIKPILTNHQRYTTNLVGNVIIATGVKEGPSLEAKALDATPSLGLTTLLPTACTGNAQKTTKAVKRARGMILVVDIN